MSGFRCHVLNQGLIHWCQVDLPRLNSRLLFTPSPTSRAWCLQIPLGKWPLPAPPPLNTQPLMEQDSYAERRGCDSCPQAIASESADCTGSRLPTRRGTLCRLARGLARVLVRQFFPQGTIARERYSSAGLSPPMRDLSAAWQAGSMSWTHTLSYPLRWPFWMFLSPLRTSSPPHSHLMILVKKEKQLEENCFWVLCTAFPPITWDELCLPLAEVSPHLGSGACVLSPP